MNAHTLRELTVSMKSGNVGGPGEHHPRAGGKWKKAGIDRQPAAPQMDKIYYLTPQFSPVRL